MEFSIIEVETSDDRKSFIESVNVFKACTKPTRSLRRDAILVEGVNVIKHRSVTPWLLNVTSCEFSRSFDPGGVTIGADRDPTYITELAV